MDSVQVKDIGDDLDAYVTAIVQNGGAPNKLILDMDSTLTTPGQVMLTVVTKLLSRLLGPPESWDVTALQPHQWQHVVDLLRCTEWTPCVACALDVPGLSVAVSDNMPGHHLWQRQDWDGVCPVAALDAQPAILWVVPGCG